MKPDPPWLLSYWLGSGGCAGITAYQQVTPATPKGFWALPQVPFGVGMVPMFSKATLNPASVTGRPASMAPLLKANSWAPLKNPPPKPGTFPFRGNSS